MTRGFFFAVSSYQQLNKLLNFCERSLIAFGYFFALANFSIENSIKIEKFVSNFKAAWREFVE